MADSIAVANARDAARVHDHDCQLCEHRCGVDRGAGELGRCRAGAATRVFRHRIEVGEESGLNPSHLFYLSGCDLRCAFCIAGINAFDPNRGRVLEQAFFNAAVAWGRRQGAGTLQWVGGEPTIHLPRILEVMARCPDLPPVVWKSDFYGTPDAFDLLDGVADVYVADLKFGNDGCAKMVAGVENYFGIVTRNLKRVAARPSRLIVRHLLLPGHSECCYRPIVQWLAANLPDVEFSLRDSYMPAWRAASIEGLGRPLRQDEGNAARAIAAAYQLQVIQ